jgi:flagellar M-ring protein FliF
MFAYQRGLRGEHHVLTRADHVEGFALPDFFKAIGAARFGVMAGVAAALTAFFLYVAGVISEPPKSILFAGLEARDAAAVTSKLDSMNVPYETKGDTILVPADQVTKLRMDMAAQNLPAAGVGYEIFDKTDTFGTTAFVQNINKQRAIEGELSRSIQTIEGIESARVHLVVPERQVFSREAQAPSASVVLKTRAIMQRGQVQAVQHLVAAAVSGLRAENVSIVDDRGNLLAGGDSTQGGAGALAANQDQQTTTYEDRLRTKIESVVASIVGPGHVRVQVTANMDFNHTSTTSETFDPDSKVVRSTQSVQQSASDATGGGGNAVSVSSALPNGGTSGSGGGGTSNSGRTEETTNYEISKTVKTSTVDSGDVKRVSVAVVVDGNNTADAAGKITYAARTAKEMTDIESLVKSAIGFDAARGDQVKVTNMQFARIDAGEGTTAPEPLLGLDAAHWFKIIEAGILSLTALLIGFFVVRPLISRMFAAQAAGQFQLAQMASGNGAVPQLPAPSGNNSADGAQQQLAGPAGSTPALAAPRESIDVSGIDGKVRESSIKKVGEVVGAHPEEALAILRTWLHQPV